MENKNLAEGRFALVVRGKDLPFEKLNGLFELEDIRSVRKGEQINYLPLIVADEDEWVGSIELTTPKAEDTKLNALLAQMIVKKDELLSICGDNSVILRLSVRSDRAQIAYMLMPETLGRIVAVGLPVELTSLSWGEVV
ncbi:MAG: hypothetical protein Q4C54_07735 [Clostridia bacterium]|nr:hypothetical protein [Clostridia bacterium]